MNIRTVGDVRVLTPDLDPRDLDPVAEPPEDELVEALVDGAVWSGLALGVAGIRLSHLVNVTLTGADWRNTPLYGCRFERVDLSGARLAGVAIERCEFNGCRMTGVQLTDAVLKNVVFDGCRLDYAALTRVRVTGPVAMVECNLDNATLRRCQLPQTAISGCRLSQVELDECDLRGADLRDSDLSSLTGMSSLRGAVITGSQLGELAAALPRELDLTVHADPAR